jgi:transposase
MCTLPYKKNKSTREIAELTGISQSSLKSIHVSFRNEGFSIFRKQQRGGRVRQFLTIEQEQEFLALFTQEAQAGHTLTINKIHSALEEKLDHKVALSTVYRILKRNKWRKLNPRLRNPKANLEDQKKFKRRLPHQVQKFVAEKEKLGIKVRLTFEDEGRVGLLGKPYRCWVPNKCRPTVGARLQRKYVYAYTAVSPHDGEMFSLILPYSNSEMMSLLLKKVSEQYPDEFIVMVMDQAGWHKSKKVDVPSNKIYDNYS